MALINDSCIVFVVELDTSVGMGHFFRCFSMAGYLSFQQVRFLLVGEARSAAPLLDSEGVAWSEYGCDLAVPLDTASLCAQLGAADNVVLDGYHFTDSLKYALRQRVRSLVVIDDLLGDSVHFADVIINHAPSAKPHHYPGDPSARLLLGAKYALVRPEFLQRAGEGGLRQSVRSLTVCLGGSDPRGLSAACVEVALALDCFERVTVVLGAAASEASTTAPCWEDERVRIRRNLSASAMVNTILASDMVLCTPSGIAIECCTLNVPLMVVMTHDNQRHLWEFFTREQLALGVDFCAQTESQALSEALGLLVAQPARRQRQVAQQRRHYDGQSGQRIRAVLAQLLNY